MDMQGRKLSKRDGDVEVHAFRAAGYLPETLANFIALLGWNPGGDRERFTLAELTELFSPERIGKTNAKFDRDKLLAFNKDTVAGAKPDVLLAAFKDYLRLNETLIPSGDDALLRRLLEINEGFRTFQDIVAKCGVLFGPDDAYEYDAKAVKKVLQKADGAGFGVLDDAGRALAEVDWTHDALEEWLTAYCEAKEFGMGKVAQPLRVAVTGTTISPAIFDTLLILGKEKTLARVDRCLGLR